MTENDRNFLDSTLTQGLGAILAVVADDELARWCALALLILGTIGRYFSLRAICKAQEASDE